MKKFVTMMVVALVAVSASAASIDWTMNLGRTGKIVDSSGATLTGNVYLVLADTTFNATTAEEFETQLSAATLGTMAITAGKAPTTSSTATSDIITAGTEYNFAVVVYDAAKSVYYMSGSPTPKAAYTAGVDDPVQATFDSVMMAAPSTWTPTYTAVPEPASAMLALAGVAMLIRRRK